MDDEGVDGVFEAEGLEELAEDGVELGSGDDGFGEGPVGALTGRFGEDDGEADGAGLEVARAEVGAESAGQSGKGGVEFEKVGGFLQVECAGEDFAGPVGLEGVVEVAEGGLTDEQPASGELFFEPGEGGGLDLGDFVEPEAAEALAVGGGEGGEDGDREGGEPGGGFEDGFEG